MGGGASTAAAGSGTPRQKKKNTKPSVEGLLAKKIERDKARLRAAQGSNEGTLVLVERKFAEDSRKREWSKRTKPRDLARRDEIERFAEACYRNPPEFEAAARVRLKEDPAFDFLSGGVGAGYFRHYLDGVRGLHHDADW
eukprot:SAG22_NODE_3339_length_1770_cov_0.929982_1_plen_139_part_10